MKEEKQTQVTSVETKSDWNEPSVTWVKPELIRLEGDMNIDGKVTRSPEINIAYGPS